MAVSSDIEQYRRQDALRRFRGSAARGFAFLLRDPPLLAATLVLVLLAFLALFGRFIWTNGPLTIDVGVVPGVAVAGASDGHRQRRARRLRALQQRRGDLALGRRDRGRGRRASSAGAIGVIAGRPAAGWTRC